MPLSGFGRWWSGSHTASRDRPVGGLKQRFQDWFACRRRNGTGRRALPQAAGLRQVAKGEARLCRGPLGPVPSLARLGLIVVDEEHEHAYKQEDQVVTTLATWRCCVPASIPPDRHGQRDAVPRILVNAGMAGIPALPACGAAAPGRPGIAAGHPWSISQDAARAGIAGWRRLLSMPSPSDSRPASSRCS